MSALEVLGRTLADMSDEAAWQAAHADVIGSYQAGAFAKPESVETYLRQIISSHDWDGNASTESGRRWEPLLLAWAGAEPNSLLIHHPDEHQFAATVDGTTSQGASFGIVETKSKHNKVVAGPTPREIRQMAWQLFCIPEAVEVRYVWGELIRDPLEGWRLRRDPLTLVYPRDHPLMVAALALIVPIAHDVLAALRRVRAIEDGAFL